MRTAMRLDEWLEANVFSAQPDMALLHDTELPVINPNPKRKKRKYRPKVRRTDSEIATRRARFDREARKHWKTLYPSDS